MILTNDDVETRLNSPLNLMNRLRTVTSRPEIVSIPQGIIDIGNDNSTPLLPPPIDELIDNMENKVNGVKANNLALKVLASSLGKLDERLCEVETPEKLSRVASEMGKLLSSMNDHKNHNKKGPQSVIIYKPVMVSESTFETVYANE